MNLTAIIVKAFMLVLTQVLIVALTEQAETFMDTRFELAFEHWCWPGEHEKICLKIDQFASLTAI